MSKKSKLVGKSLYDIVTTKSKKFIDKLKAPLEKKKLKRAFENRISDAVAAIYESKADEIELLMEVKDIDVDSILELNNQRNEIYNDMCGIADIYENIFGETIELEITSEDLAVSSADILSQASAIDEEDDD